MTPIESLARRSEHVYDTLSASGFKWAPHEDVAGTLVTPPGQRDYYEWYFAYGRILRPRRLLEIGVFGGGSVTALALGAGDALESVRLIDNESDGRSLEDAALKLRAATANRFTVEFARVDSQRIHRLDGPPFDVISIDGDHRIGPCYHDLRITLPVLAPEGHIICDDGRWEWVRDAVADFVHDHPDISQFYMETFTGTRVLHRCKDGTCPLLVQT